MGSDPERFFQVGSEMPPQEKEKLIDFLRQNVDVFAWDAYEAPGVNPNFICHHLNVSPAVTPKKQPRRRPSKEHADAVREEVMKLKKAGAIKEVFYPEWLANTVVVEEVWEMASLRELHRLEQGLPEGSFPYASDRPIGGFDRGTPSNKLFGCLPRLPSNTPGCRRPRKNSFCHPR